MKLFKVYVLLFCIGLSPIQLVAEELVFQDNNGDGTIRFLAFGDSITFGVGDGVSAGAFVEEVSGGHGGGYPKRVSDMTDIKVTNAGFAGEIFTEEGYRRLPGLLSNAKADFLVFLEGANDATFQVGSSAYRLALQKVINVAFASNVGVVLVTLPPPCCNHAGLDFFTGAYNQVMRSLANINDVFLADVEKNWLFVCSDPKQCGLLNLPEGLHPNAKGYDLIAQTVLATLYGIDLLEVGGSAKLEATLGLEPGSLIIQVAAE
ncbi:GDSL-type esterase/lipase family protein [Oligoflexia bacterium]|nr:GDSL-type esterase/lipase family protein [Oligoflexia bacterium]